MAYANGSHERTGGDLKWATEDELRHIRHYAGSTKGGTLEAKEKALVGYLEAAQIRSRWGAVDRHAARFAAEAKLREVRGEIARASK